MVTKNIIYNFIGQTTLFLIGFFATPYIIHTLGNDLYGILVLVTSLVGYFSVLDLGLGVGIIKYISEYQVKNDREGLKKVLGVALTLYIIAGLIGGASIFILANVLIPKFLHIPSKLIPEALTVFYISSFGFFINMVLTVFNAIPQALQKMSIVNSRNVLLGALNVFGTVLILLMGFGIIEIAVWGVITSVLATVIFVKEVHKLIPNISLLPSFDRQIFLKLLKFSGYKFLGNISGQIVFQLDRLLIGIFYPIMFIAFYASPMIIIQKGTAALSNITMAVFPAISQAHGLNNIIRIKKLYWKMTKLTVFLMVPIFTLLFIFADKILFFWLGAEFAQKSTLVLRILSFAFLVVNLSAPAVTISEAVGQPKIPSLFATVSALINLPLALIFIPKLGIEGAALALLINFISQVPIFIYIVNKRIAKVSTSYLIRKIYLKTFSACMIAVTFSLITVHLLNQTLINFMFGLLVFFTSYIFICIKLNFIENEDLQFMGIVKKRAKIKNIVNQSFGNIWEDWLQKGEFQNKVKEHIKQRQTFLVFLKRFLNKLPDGSNVLEIGAGTAIDSSYLARQYPKINFWGTDISDKSIKLGKKIARLMGANIKLVSDDATSSKLPSEKFGLVFSQGVVEHFPNPDQIMNEQKRILKKGGFLVIDVPQKFNPYTIYKHEMIKKGSWPYGWETEYSVWSLMKLGKKSGLKPLAHIGYGYGYEMDYGFNKLTTFGDRLNKKIPLLSPIGNLYTLIIKKIEENFGAYFMLSVVVAFKKSI